MSATLVIEETVVEATGRPAAEVSRLEREAIDRSARVPVLTFYAFALFWLLFTSVFALLAGWELLAPHFLGNVPWLTYGRLRPMAENAMMYGWASQAGMGTAIWLMARLCRVQIRYPLMVAFGALLWNLGVAAGSIGILAGDGSPFRWLQYPPYARWLIFVGYLAIGIWAIILYRLRSKAHIFVSQWFLLVAFLCFPWLLATAGLMLFAVPVPGAVQTAVHSWFAGNLIGLWLTSLGLGAAYYMIPKVTGRPIYSYNLAAFGFWTFLLFFSWRGAPDVHPGPLPAWVSTIGVVATILSILPVATIALNHHMTIRGSFDQMHFSPTLRFTVVGAMAFTGSSLLAVVLSLRTFSNWLGFTWAMIAYDDLVIYTFFTMVMFGSMYYIIPRLVGCEWRSAWLIKMHFWGCGYGIGLLIMMLFLAGICQGSDFGDSSAPFMQSVESTLPFLRGSVIALIMLLLGHCVFAFHILIMMLRLGHPAGTPTLLEDEGGAH